MSRCVVIGGADINTYERVKSFLQEDDFNIFCDCGIRHLEPLGIKPNLIVGDFDSHENPHMTVETIVLPCEKDDTDSVYAVKEGLKRGFDEFLLIGMIGGRFDHSLGNIGILNYLETCGVKARLIDDYSVMEMVSQTPKYIENKYSFFSLLNVSGTAKGINIEEAKYLLKDGEITCDYQYGVSNEVLPGKTAKVWVNDGRLLLIKDF